MPALPITIGASTDRKPIALERAGMSEEIERMQKQLDALTGFAHGLLIGLTTLIQTHPNHRQWNLVLASLTERQLSGGVLLEALTPDQRQSCEQVCLLLQQIAPVKKEIDPLSFLKGKPSA